MNVADLLLRSAEARADQLALAFEGQTFHYGDLQRLVVEFSLALRERGVEVGARVALLLPNSPAFVIAYYAIQRLGAVAVSIGVMSTRAEIEAILRDSGARVLVIAGDQGDNLPADGVVEHVLTAGPELWAQRTIAGSAWASAPTTSRDLTADTAAALLYTSGTMGAAKGVTLSVSNIVTNAEAAADCYGATPDDRFLLFLPLSHCFAQNAIMNAATLSGAAVVLQSRFVPEAVIESVRSGHVTHFFAVPSVYVRLLALGFSKADFAHVRYFFSAAAPLPQSVSLRWAELTGRNIHEGYGLTETSPFATYNHRSSYRLGTVGTPVHGVRIRVTGADGEVVPSGAIGEVEIAGPNVMLGYWKRPADTAQAVRNGWFRSGDLGCVDSDGYLSIVGRAKEMIIVSGYKVYPFEVEKVLLDHPAIADVAVFGMPDDVTDEVVHARVVLRANAALDAAALRTYCLERLAKYKVPKHIEMAEGLPKSPVGKILRRELRKEVLSRRPAQRLLRAYVFPGQGMQKQGMGRGLFEKFPELVQQADAVLGYSIEKLCLEDPERVLGLTQFAQPAIYVTNALHYLSQREQDASPADYFAGHSLGELNALLAARAFDFATGLELVKRRAGAMAKAKRGTMAVVVGAAQPALESALDEFKTTDITIANYNAPDQFVLAGNKKSLERLKPRLEKLPGVAAFAWLRTSGAFHSPHMEDARLELAAYLKTVTFSELAVPVVSGVTGRLYESGAVQSQLEDQLTSPVLWMDVVRCLRNLGVSEFLELGEGRVLTGLIAKIVSHDGKTQSSSGRNDHGHRIGATDAQRTSDRTHPWQSFRDERVLALLRDCAQGTLSVEAVVKEIRERTA